MTIGDRIKQLRKELKLTQTEFGEKIGVARITVVCYENNSHKVSDYIIKNICSVNLLTYTFDLLVYLINKKGILISILSFFLSVSKFECSLSNLFLLLSFC